MKIQILLFVALLPIAMTGSSSAQMRYQPRRLDAEAREKCLAAGGEIKIAGLSANEMCALPYRDAGKVCSGKSDCEGDCLFDGDYPRFSREQPLGAPLAGKCQALAYPFGCQSRLNEGKVYTMCLD